jgi:hypothetical protein
VNGIAFFANAEQFEIDGIYKMLKDGELLSVMS